MTQALNIRKSEDRGYADHGWLEARHSFSFAGYHDPAHMGFRALRVINEDRVQAGEGFGTHPHKDMEIITYLLEGELAHKDSMGNGRTIKPGEVQVMSAGTGVTHSEFNARNDSKVHLLQIWIIPHTKNVQPSYSEWYPKNAVQNAWVLAVSEDGQDGSCMIHQDARMYVGKFDAGKNAEMPLRAEHYGWLQVARGEVEIEGKVLKAGDGASFEKGTTPTLKAIVAAELLWFDLP